MKKSICLLVSLICTSVILFSGCLGGYADLFSGCSETKDPWKLKEEEGGFYYCYKDKQGEIVKDLSDAEYSVIIGLTEELYQTEEIVIPEKLGGCYVKYIGTMYTFYFGTKKYSLHCYDTAIKKIIINHDINVYYIDHFTGDLILNASTNASTSVMYYCRSVQINKDINISDICSEFEDDTEFYSWLYEKRKSVTTFNATGGQQTTYKYIMNDNDLIPKPEDPTKDGYVFAGWFKDENYETEWNFETDRVIRSKTLYAKWEKI